MYRPVEVQKGPVMCPALGSQPHAELQGRVAGEIPGNPGLDQRWCDQQDQDSDCPLCSTLVQVTTLQRGH